MQSKRRIIYIIDDDPLDADLTRRAILRCVEMAKLTWFEKASEALEDIKNRSHLDLLPDLVFIDLKMPGMNGVEWLNEVRRFCSKHELIVVVFSSSNLFEDKSASLEAGANLYVVKPTELGEFRLAIQGAVETLLVN